MKFRRWLAIKIDPSLIWLINDWRELQEANERLKKEFERGGRLITLDMSLKSLTDGDSVDSPTSRGEQG